MSHDPGVSRRRIEGPVVPARLRIGRNVERLRVERGITPDALAARARLDVDGLGEIERGERKVLTDVVYLLAAALGVEPNALFEGVRWIPPAEGGTGFVITGGDPDDG
jgi:transcriptional regulator with XRE-family HTH domain